jgi:hypothetical protein
LCCGYSQQPASQAQGQHLPPQSLHLQSAGFAAAVKAKAATAMSAKMIFFIFFLR